MDDGLNLNNCYWKSLDIGDYLLLVSVWFFVLLDNGDVGYW